jgi:hypothetical protein
LPGVQVLNDPAGDQTGTPNANQQLDLTAAYVAEPFVSNTDHSITFTIKVSTLSPTLPPNATWQLNMVTTDTNGTSRTIFFDMNTASTGATASFDYGYHDPSQNIDLSQCGIPVPLISSCPVTGSSTADGTITITVNTSQPLQFFDATGTHAFDVNLLAAGKSLTNMNAVTTLLVGAGGSGIVTTIDQMTTGTGSYLTVGNGACSGSGTPTPTPSTTPTPTPTNPGEAVVKTIGDTLSSLKNTVDVSAALETVKNAITNIFDSLVQAAPSQVINNGVQQMLSDEYSSISFSVNSVSKNSFTYFRLPSP